VSVEVGYGPVCAPGWPRRAADTAATRPDLKTFVEMRERLCDALLKLELREQNVARLEQRNAYLERELGQHHTNALKEVIGPCRTCGSAAVCPHFDADGSTAPKCRSDPVCPAVFANKQACYFISSGGRNRPDVMLPKVVHQQVPHRVVVFDNKTSRLAALGANSLARWAKRFESVSTGPIRLTVRRFSIAV
jgi:hypothetical protein